MCSVAVLFAVVFAIGDRHIGDSFDAFILAVAEACRFGITFAAGASMAIRLLFRSRRGLLRFARDVRDIDEGDGLLLIGSFRSKEWLAIAYRG